VDDVEVMNEFGCNADWINYWWDSSNYDYDDTDWDDGLWGMQAMCDLTYPLARSFVADWLLEKVPFWADYARDRIDQLDGEDCSTATAAWTLPGPKIDGVSGYTNLRIRYFYNYKAVERAGMLPHEAAHAAWIPHTAAITGGCQQGYSCDSVYGDFGPYSIEVDFLKAFVRDCHNSLKQRQIAAQRILNLGTSVFVTQPGPTAVIPTKDGC
jgi:hypothetical protein